jgi:flavodoxin
MTMGIAVVFYSAQGNSALAAKALSEKLGAKLIELKEKKTRNLEKIGPAFMLAGMQASLKVRTKLQGMPWQDVTDCGELHIIMPIWAAKPAPAVNTFLSKCNFNGKKVFLYTVQADPNDTARPAREKLARALTKKGATVAGSFGLAGSAPGKEPSQELAQKICGF